MQRSWSHQERNLQLWKLQGLFNFPHLLGPVLHTWWRNLMVPGGLVAITAISTLRPSLKDTPNRYSLPNIADFSGRLHSSKEFSKLDLIKGGYYQVPKSSGDIPKTTVIMPFLAFLSGWRCRSASCISQGLVIWFHHLPLVLLGLQSVPREDSAIYASETLFGSPLVLPRGFLDSPELPLLEYLRRIQPVLKNNTTVLPHHSAVTALKPYYITFLPV